MPVISIDVLSLLPPLPTPQAQDPCHDKIAKIFGGSGAVGGDHGTMPGKTNSNPVGAEKGHIYPSLGGTGQTNIYFPAGYDFGVFAGGDDSTAYFYYGKNDLYGLKNVTLLVQHLANPNINERKRFATGPVENGRVRIGTTGGLDGGANPPNYQHVHIEVFRGEGLPRLLSGKSESQQTNRNKARIPYREVFCK
ncbi:MAG: hypothetical protein AABN33_26200 [Acidobacteriota bacterium]